MDLATLIPITLFLVLAILFALVLRRAGQVLAATRELDWFRRAVVDLAARIDTSLGGVIERVDLVRRGQLDPDAIADNVSAAIDATQRYIEEAEKLPFGPATAPLRSQIVGDLERAERALQMVEHGCAVLSSVRGKHQRELEGQTAIKRGYLNLLHAREAIVRHAAEIEAYRPQPETPWLRRRPEA